MAATTATAAWNQDCYYSNFERQALGPDSVLIVTRCTTTTDVFCSCTVGRTVVGRADGDCRTNVETAAGNHQRGVSRYRQPFSRVHEFYLGNQQSHASAKANLLDARTICSQHCPILVVLLHEQRFRLHGLCRSTSVAPNTGHQLNNLHCQFAHYSRQTIILTQPGKLTKHQQNPDQYISISFFAATRGQG